MRSDAQVYSVSEINNHIKALFDADGFLSDIFVRGEVSNYRLYPSGHRYFTLKDANGVIRCVFFKHDSRGLPFEPQDGMTVIASGRVSVFPRDGQYQLYFTSLLPEGMGQYHIAFEKLKEKLQGEGLFDIGHKKPIPKYPMRIALITSPAGAAVRDMLRILKARWPVAQVYVLPVRVQGEEAPGEICGAIRYANDKSVADLIVTGRGGGSIEDLWAFNSEDVARTIFASEIPVISAVGHEPDVTIADFAADLRAATPSNAAELAVPDITEIFGGIETMNSRLSRAVSRQLGMMRERLSARAEKKVLKDPRYFFEERRISIGFYERRAGSAFAAVLAGKKEKFSALSAKIDAMSPLKVLGRGYAIASLSDGKILKSAAQAAVGEKLTLRLSEGSVGCVVDSFS